MGDPIVIEHVSGQSNTPLSRPPHALTPDDVIKELDANAVSGLTDTEASARFQQHGPNELEQEKGVQPWAIFLAQIFNAMTLVCGPHIAIPRTFDVS